MLDWCCHGEGVCMVIPCLGYNISIHTQHYWIYLTVSTFSTYFVGWNLIKAFQYTTFDRCKQTRSETNVMLSALLKVKCLGSLTFSAWFTNPNLPPDLRLELASFSICSSWLCCLCELKLIQFWGWLVFYLPSWWRIKVKDDWPIYRLRRATPERSIIHGW